MNIWLYLVVIYIVFEEKRSESFRKNSSRPIGLIREERLRCWDVDVLPKEDRIGLRRVLLKQKFEDNPCD